MTTRQPRDAIAPVGATDEKLAMQEFNHANTPPTIVVATALPSEYVAFEAMLDNRQIAANTALGEYSTGLVASEYGGSHSVILISIGVGNNSAATRVTALLHAIPSIKYCIVSGIAGGVPNPAKEDHDIRLGDLVISDTTGVIQYDFLKDEGEYDFKPRHPPRPSDPHLLDAVQALRRKEQVGEFPWRENLLRKELKKLNRRPSGQDVLHSASLVPIERPTRKERHRPRVFHGPVASGDRLLKNVKFRDYVLQQHGAKAVEMEASGVAEAAYQRRVGILVVRGICDYCDKTKADGWQQYAAAVAAAYTRSVIQYLPGAATGSVAASRSTRTPSTPPGGGYTLDRGSRTNPSVMLGASYRTLPFNRNMRSSDWNTLSDWWGSKERFRICLVTGPGGAGKTRFAIEAATTLEIDGWAVDFRPSDSADVANGSLDPARENLVVLDYAETRKGLAATISSYLKSTKRVRLLLLARNKSEWWTMLRRHSTEVADALDNAKEITINPLTAAERVEFYLHAHTAFGRQMSVRSPPPSPSLDAKEFERPLYIAMAAYADIANITWTADTLLDCILEHEERWWFTSSHDHLLTTSNLRYFRTVLSSTTLLGGLESSDSLHALTSSISEPIRDHIIERTRTLYPGSSDSTPFVSSLQPDLLGEALVLRVMSDAGTPLAYLRNVLAHASTRGAQHLFFVVGRIEVRQPVATRIGELVEFALADDANWESGVRAALALGKISPYGNIGHWLTRAVAMSPARHSRAETLHKLLPPTTVSLAELAVIVSESRRQSLAGRDLDCQADAADEAAQRYQQSGRLQDALRASADAVAICATRSRPDVYDSLRLRCLTNYASLLSADGKISESVRIYRTVAEARRAIALRYPRDANHKSALALVLANLGIALSRIHDYHHATMYTREALNIYKQLHGSKSGSYTADVARLLSNLAAREYEEGNHAGALTHCVESCELLEDLILEHPDQYIVQWAETKLQLATMQRDAGQPDTSQSTCDQVVDRILKIPSHTIHQFTPLLARAYHTRAISLSAAGKLTTSANEIRRSLELLRTRVSLGESGDRLALARSIVVAANRESEVGRHDAAAELDEESIRICRDVLVDSPSPTVSDLMGQAWFNLSNHRRLNNQPKEALEAALEAARIFESLARAANHVGEVAVHSRKSLSMVGKLLLRMGQQQSSMNYLLSATEFIPSTTGPASDIRSYVEATLDLVLSASMAPDSRVLGRLQSAEALSRQVISLSVSESVVSLARVLIATANILINAGRSQEAVAHAQEAVDLIDGHAHHHTADHLASLDALARAFGAQGNFAKAVVVSTKAATIADKYYQIDSFDLARVYGYVAFDALNAHDTASGQTASRRALRLALPQVTGWPPDYKMEFLRWLGVYELLLIQAGHVPDSDELFSSCIRLVPRAAYEAAKKSPATMMIRFS